MYLQNRRHPNSSRIYVRKTQMTSEFLREFQLKSTQYKKLELNASHIKIWNLANHMKKWNKEHQTLSFQFFTNKSSILMFFVLFFHVVCKISNFNMWTAKHLVQASCTELTLSISIERSFMFRIKGRLKNKVHNYDLMFIFKALFLPTSFTYMHEFNLWILNRDFRLS